MQGLMQDRPLLISSLLEHAARYHPHVEIVGRTCEGPTVRTNWRDLAKRVAKLANALRRMGVGPGDRVASLAWNTHRHVELYFAVSGIGAVLNTVNPRLFSDQIEYIVNHAENRVLFFDITFAGLVAELRGKLSTVERFVALTDRAHLPDGVPAEAYEDLLGPEAERFDWPVLDECAASSLCYTSGTTGHPKGVLYTHRSTILHSFMVCTADGFRLSSADTVLLAVPLFHVNAWGIPYAAAMCGAKLVLPGPKLDGKSLFELAVAEQCTFSLGVPTIWLGFFQHLDDTPGLDTSGLRLERVVIGGSAAPRAIIERFRRELGVFVIQAWGMSETSPVATVGNLLPKHRDLPENDQIDVQARQGRVVYGVELKIVDEHGNPLPQDGSVAGDLYVRGPWVSSGYFKGVGGDMLDADGWFPTGDVAKIDGDGYVVLTDRSKDVIKSGGEWISSIDLENAAVAHPAVLEAAVIGLPHPRWQERPFLVVVVKPDTAPSRDEILAFLSTRVPKWWVPDDVAFVSELPHTATGKLQKTKLREQFRTHVLSA